MDGDVQTIEDEAEKAILRKQAARVRLKSTIAALILTALVLPFGA